MRLETPAEVRRAETRWLHSLWPSLAVLYALETMYPFRADRPPEPAADTLGWANAWLTCPECGWEGRVVWPLCWEELDCPRCGGWFRAPHWEDLQG